MENVIFDGIILIRESAHISGLPLLCAYLRRALDLSFNINLILGLHLREDLPTKFASDKRVRIMDCCEILSIDQLISLIKSVPHMKEKNILFIDFINIFFEKFGTSKVAALLNLLLRNHDYRAVIMVLNNSVSPPVDQMRISDFAFTVLNLRNNLSDMRSSCSEKRLKKSFCRCITRKKDGMLSEKVESFEISDESFIIKSVAVNSLPTVDELVKTETTGSYDSPFEGLPFDVGLNLKEKERKAKANLKLPHTNAQNQKGLVNLNISAGKKVRVGGQIVYTPDNNDDLDDSDPDDDLMI